LVSTKSAEALRAVAGTNGARAVAAALMDETAFTALYQSTAAPLRAYAARVLGNVTAADDVVQETYLRVLRRPVPAADAGALRAYVFRVATHIMIDHFRRQQRERSAAADPRAMEAPHDAALAIDMARLFARLRPRDRQLMWLAHVEGFEHREIAAALGLGERSVRVLLSRARQKLAKMLRGDRTVGETR